MSHDMVCLLDYVRNGKKVNLGHVYLYDVDLTSRCLKGLRNSPKLPLQAITIYQGDISDISDVWLVSAPNLGTSNTKWRIHYLSGNTLDEKFLKLRDLVKAAQFSRKSLLQHIKMQREFQARDPVPVIATPTRGHVAAPKKKLPPVCFMNPSQARFAKAAIRGFSLSDFTKQEKKKLLDTGESVV